MNFSGNILLGIAQLRAVEKVLQMTSVVVSKKVSRTTCSGDNILCAADVKRLITMTSAKTKVFIITEDDANKINELIPTDLKAAPK